MAGDKVTDAADRIFLAVQNCLERSSLDESEKVIVKEKLFQRLEGWLTGCTEDDANG